MEKQVGQLILDVAKQNKWSREELIRSLYGRSINQLISDYVIEFEAKNKAYYFILGNGHLEAFEAYCKNLNKT